MSYFQEEAYPGKKLVWGQGADECQDFPLKSSIVTQERLDTSLGAWRSSDTEKGAWQSTADLNPRTQK